MIYKYSCTRVKVVCSKLCDTQCSCFRTLSNVNVLCNFVIRMLIKYDLTDMKKINDVIH